MNRFKCSLLLKIVAFLLAVASSAVAATAALTLVYGYDQGAYGTKTRNVGGQWTQSDGSYLQSYACNNLADKYAWRIASSFAEGGDVEAAYDDYYNFDFIIRETDETGKILVSTVRSDAAYGYREGWTHSFERTVAPANGEPVDDTVPPENSLETYYVEIAVLSSMQGDDEFFWGNRLFDVLHQIQPVLIPVMVGCLLLALASTIWLFCAVGHKKGREGIVLSGVNLIPLDLYTAALVGGILLLLFSGFEVVGYYYSNIWVTGGLLMAVLVGADILALALLVSFAARCKAGKWWRNSLTYYVLNRLLRYSKRLWQTMGRMTHAIPMVWRTLLIVPAVILVDIILVSMGRWSGFWMLTAFFYNVALLLAIAFGVWQMRKLQQAGKELAGGNFEYKTDTQKMYWDFKQHAENLNAIGGGMAIAVEQRMRSERLKTELITNVSHDIKTPLTSIVNYVDLLQKPHTEDEGREYLAVLQRQSARLKKLTEDLVEASKASTGNVSANLVRTNVVEIVNQALGEYAERLAAGNLTVLTDLPEKEIPVLADGRLLWRIMDNLLSNVCKYALGGTRVYVSVGCDGETVIAVKNISREPLNVSAEELMERFVRGDTARSTDGSGLGLNIAKSLTQLQGGSFELFVDGDLFKAEVRLPSL